MKLVDWVLIGFLAVMGLFCRAEPLEMSIGTSAVKVLPERNFARGYGTPWAATTAVAQGAILSHGTAYWMVHAAGTLGSTAPAYSSAVLTTNGTAVLRYVERGPRTGFILMLNEAGPVRLSLGSPAVAGKGLTLEGEGCVWQEAGPGAPQGPIYVISDAGANKLAVVEW